MGRMWSMREASESPRTNGEERVGNGVRDALLRRQSYAREVLPLPAGSSPDPMAAAREREDEAVHLAVIRRRHERDGTVEEVLHSLATGQYGRCIECGQHIALARLRAMPLAVRCLACQERFERIARIAAAREARYDTQEVSL